ncbi:MAG: vanadium-dependent haloperoxidase [Acidobacteria bacterium]|nr:vanadium-dependent haloperoxidase [Acidobacteriota bacterium]
MKDGLLVLIGSTLLLSGCAMTSGGAGDSAAEPAVAEVRASEVPGSELIVAWNENLLSAADAEDGFLTLKGLRTAAMMHSAIHDALSAVYGRYHPLVELAPAPEADPVAAAAQAAFEVAVSQYPKSRSRWQADLDRWLAEVPGERARARGVELGKTAAAAVVSSRQGDGWDGEAEYQWHPMGPGVYAEFNEHSGTPEGFIFGAGWAVAKPFVLESSEQFRAPPPPEIGTDAYTRAFEEVKDAGRYKSTVRTADQTHLALWWKDFVERSHNRLARTLTEKESLDLVEAARLFALLNLSIYDAYLDVFNNKFLYNHWRPYTAIRWAEHDGNPATKADPEWNNTHRHTYAFPSYPSAHGTACAAAMTVMEEVFGPDYAFTMRTEEVDSAGPFSPKMKMDPPTRSFPSFAAAAAECALSRIYLGIHFRYDSEEGTRLGEKVGGYIVHHALQKTGA